MKRYSAPIIVLDLVKQLERRPREMIVGKEFLDAVVIINESLPPESKIRYSALDFSRMSKAKKASLRENDKIASLKEAAAPSGTGKEWSSFVESSMRNNKDPKSQSPDNTQKDESAEGGGAGVGTTAGRIDVIRELEDMAAYTINQTSIFCRYKIIEYDHSCD
jgi:hypothetical protein